MKTISSLSNPDIDSLAFNQIYSKILHVEMLREKLHKRNEYIFKRIVEAVKINDEFLSKMLATELFRIRILERNLVMFTSLLKRLP